jgi:hypothetical protein
VLARSPHLRRRAFTSSSRDEIVFENLTASERESVQNKLSERQGKWFEDVQFQTM